MKASPAWPEEQDVPEWFTAAVATPGEVGEVPSGGAVIRYRRWGPDTRRGLVLVHGAAAHSNWWDHIAPLLDPQQTVIALDLSGHGSSGRRGRYTVQGWGDEVLAVADHAGLSEAILVGHSMGGVICLAAASSSGPCAPAPTAVVALDSVVRGSRSSASAHGDNVRAPLRVYPTSADALGRFRTVPAQPDALPFVLEHIARMSLRETTTGWIWRFDPMIFDHDRWPVARLTGLACPAVLVVAEHGILDASTVSAMRAAGAPRLRTVAFPAAHHHMMIDKPTETMTVIRDALALMAGDH